MLLDRIVENVFFFGFMVIVAYIMWQMLAPFISALALSAIIVTICYPLYARIVRHMPRQNETLAALLTTGIVILVVILPLLFVASSIVREAVSIYHSANGSSQAGLTEGLLKLQTAAQKVAPGVDLNIAQYVKQVTAWLAGNVGAIFAGTASTAFLFFISIIGSFYLFRDGKRFTKQLVAISPLPDDQDELILHRMAVAVRSVATGSVLVALTQGTLTSIGLTLFGFQQAVLLGVIAAIGALIPSVGTSIVYVPSVLYLVFLGDYSTAIGLALWGTFAVGLIDNFLGPHLMSRGHNLHPFVILISVLGGISLFGPVGFVVGPVVVSLFVVLLELYAQHISNHDPIFATEPESELP